MSLNFERPGLPRSFDRREGDRPVPRSFTENASLQPLRPEAAPVTLEKVGDFLDLDLRRILVWLRGGFWLIVIVTVLGAAAAVSYGLFAVHRYSVSVDVLIDPSTLQVVTNDLYAQPGQTDAQMLIVSNRLHIMTSGNVLARVVGALDLAADPEFYDPAPHGLAKWFGSAPPPAADPDTAALKALQKQVSVTAEDRSFVASLSVSSISADKAIVISNEIVKAFQAELAQADADVARRAAASLDERLNQLKREVLEAEEKVETYKQSSNLTVGKDGQLVSSQSLTELNTQLAAARQRVVDAQVSYNALLKAGTDSVVTQSSVPTGLALLLDKANALRQQVDAMSTIYGARHPSIARMKSELAAMNEQVQRELTRSTNAAKSELDKANAAIVALRTQMGELEKSAFNDNQSQVELRELQRDATSKSAIYESFLSRARQITEREQINTTNVRVISPAIAPSARSWPPSNAVLLVLGTFVGLVAGLTMALLRGIVSDMRAKPKNLTPA